ncbi:hypothetical protein LEP1GSC192_3425 [Leptospira sp. B5-022]|nr:hypothetical protein LEP1GSC192_3425 [Leptospira sp. B5-022]
MGREFVNPFRFLSYIKKIFLSVLEKSACKSLRDLSILRVNQ